MSARFPDLPATMRALPIDHRGFPVPWFVAWVDGRKFYRAYDEKRCWVCGGELGRLKAFVIGPMARKARAKAAAL